MDNKEMFENVKNGIGLFTLNLIDGSLCLMYESQCNSYDDPLQFLITDDDEIALMYLSFNKYLDVSICERSALYY